MGKMKELFMQQHQQEFDDLEFLRDDILAQEKSYEDFLKLQQEDEFRNPVLNTKIEIGNEQIRKTDTEKHSNSQ